MSGELIRLDSFALLNRNEKRTTREMRSLILALEHELKNHPDVKFQDDFDTRHHFHDGIYMRELHIPKGTLLTGKIHVYGHFNILSQGKISVWTEKGMLTLAASTVIESKPAIKRVGFTHEDSVWITVHKNEDNETNISKIEDRLFCETFREGYLKSPKTFLDAIQFLGFSEQEVKTMSENTSDQIDFPYPLKKIKITDSFIQGKGVFALSKIEENETIGPALVLNRRTPLGRFCNHDGNPNAKMVKLSDGNVDLIATRPIEIGQEICNDYFLSVQELERKLICLP